MKCITCTSEASMKCSECGEALCMTCFLADDGKCKTCIDSSKFKLDFVRRSYLDDYEKCPYYFWLNVVKGIPQPPTIYTQLGIDVHDIIEEAWKNPVTLQTSLDRFEKIWNTYESDLFGSVSSDKMYERGITSLENAHKLLLELPPPLMTEETLQFSVGEGIPLVQMTMDGVYEDSQGLQVLDWKTGKVLSGKKLSTDMQAPLYLYGINQHLGRVSDYFTFHYLSEDKKRTYEKVTDDKYVCTVRKREYEISLMETVRRVKTILGRINSGHFSIPAKPDYFKCKMCHYREIGMCSGNSEEAWNQAWGK